MNIAMVVYAYYSRDARVRRYAESLARHGHVVDCISLKENYAPKDKRISLIGFPLVRKRLSKTWYFFEYLLFFIFSSWVLTTKFISRKYKIIHVHNMPEALVFTASIVKMFGAKIVLDMHDPMPELYLSKYEGSEHGPMLKVLLFMEEISLRFSTHIITANSLFRALFLKRHTIKPTQISVVENCPDNRIFKSYQQEKNREDFRMVYMGTVEERFQLDIAIQSIPKLIESIPNLRFCIVPKLNQEGEYFSFLRKHIRNNKLSKYVLIKQPQSLENIAKMMTNADIGIVLAKKGVYTDNIFSVKLLELIQMNVPVIASKTKMLVSQFSSNQLFFLPKNTTEYFTKAVLTLYKDKKLRKTLAINAKKYLTIHNWKMEEKKYLNQINSLFLNARRNK